MSRKNEKADRIIIYFAKLMKWVAGRQTRYLNKLEKRTGSLWEGDGKRC
jgi:hypothetical protein